MPYSSLATLYDRINGEIYAPYAEFLDGAIRKYSEIPVQDVLDLGCGTGKITALMADKGYGMVGVDLSAEMLNLAREANEGKNTLLLMQDMREFELYGTVQAAYSSFDCLNYIESAADLRKVFRLIANYLEPGGVFVFDVNTEYRFRAEYGDNVFTYEFEDDLLVWRNEPLGSKVGTRFVLDRFYDRKDDGTCRFEHEEQEEFFHPEKRIALACAAAGLTPVAKFGGLHGEPLTETSGKAFYILRR